MSFILDYMMDLCDYKNVTTGVVDKVDDNYHTGNLGYGVHVSFRRLKQLFLMKGILML